MSRRECNMLTLKWASKLYETLVDDSCCVDAYKQHNGSFGCSCAFCPS